VREDKFNFCMEDLLFLRLFAVWFESYECFFEDAGSDASSP